MSNIINYTDYGRNKENNDRISYAILGRGNGKTSLLASAIHDLINKPYFGIDNIVDVIFNDPATIVLWSDGTKTVVKCRDGEEFDPEKGLALALAKKAMGNRYNYYDVFKKYIGKYNKKRFRTALKKAMEIEPDAIIRSGVVYEKADTQEAQNKALRDIALNTAKNLRAEGKSLAEIAKIMGYDDPAVIRTILPNAW